MPGLAPATSGAVAHASSAIQPVRPCASLTGTYRIPGDGGRQGQVRRTGGSDCWRHAQQASFRVVLNRRSDFLPEQWKRLHISADRVERTMRKYAWLCIKRALG